MNNFNYGEVLTRAWKLIWKHKVLWIFGILASCARRGGSGNGGGRGGTNFQTGPNGSGNTPFPTGQFERMMNQAGEYLTNHLWIIIAVIIALILISFIFYALGLMGRIGLIKGTAIADKGAESMSFGEIWAESTPYFWRIFLLNFLIGLIFFILIVVPLVLIVAVAVMGGKGAAAGAGILAAFACLIPLLCVLIPVSWVVSAIIEQTQAAIVLENLGIMDGLKRGWQIIKSNPVPIIVMFLILGIGGAIVGLIIALPIILAFVPILMGLGALRQSSFTPLYISLACCAIYVPVLIFLNGVLTAYIQSAWTLTFMKLAIPAENTPIIIEANA